MKYAETWRKLSELDRRGGIRLANGVWVATKTEFDRFITDRGDLSTSEALDLKLMLDWIDELLDSAKAELGPRHFYLSGELAAHFDGYYPGEISIECAESLADKLTKFRAQEEFTTRLSAMGKVVPRPKMPVSLERIYQNFEQVNRTGFLQVTCYACDVSDFATRHEYLQFVHSPYDEPKPIICVTL